jgi:hypothetical protein
VDCNIGISPLEQLLAYDITFTEKLWSDVRVL